MGMKKKKPKIDVPAPPPPPAPPPQVDAPDSTALDEANKTAQAESTRRGRKKLVIPLSIPLGGGISIPS